MIVDTHTHLYLPEFDDDRDIIMSRAIEAGVDMMILPNVDRTTIMPMKNLHSAYPESTAMAIGIHPTEIGPEPKQDIDAIITELESDIAYVAIGEIGLDLHWESDKLTLQLDAFDAQLDIACEYGLPAIIHNRDAWSQMIDLFRGRHGRIPRIVLHSFCGSAEDIRMVRDVVDPMFGINGIITFKNSQLHSVLPDIGPNRILLETDSPYLAPVPHRGKRCESSFITLTAKHAAESLGISYETLCEQTSRNARELFNI